MIKVSDIYEACQMDLVLQQSLGKRINNDNKASLDNTILVYCIFYVNPTNRALNTYRSDGDEVVMNAK